MKLEEIEKTLDDEAFKYVKETITTADLNTQIIAGLAFADGAKYVINNIKERT